MKDNDSKLIWGALISEGKDPDEPERWDDSGQQSKDYTDYKGGYNKTRFPGQNSLTSGEPDEKSAMYIFGLEKGGEEKERYDADSDIKRKNFRDEARKRIGDDGMLLSDVLENPRSYEDDQPTMVVYSTIRSLDEDGGLSYRVSGRKGTGRNVWDALQHTGLPLGKDPKNLTPSADDYIITDIITGEEAEKEAARSKAESDSVSRFYKDYSAFGGDKYKNRDL